MICLTGIGPVQTSPDQENLFNPALTSERFTVRKILQLLVLKIRRPLDKRWGWMSLEETGPQSYSFKAMNSAKSKEELRKRFSPQIPYEDSAWFTTS